MCRLCPIVSLYVLKWNQVHAILRYMKHLTYWDRDPQKEKKSFFFVEIKFANDTQMILFIHMQIEVTFFGFLLSFFFNISRSFLVVMDELEYIGWYELDLLIHIFFTATPSHPKLYYCSTLDEIIQSLSRRFLYTLWIKFHLCTLYTRVG